MTANAPAPQQSSIPLPKVIGLALLLLVLIVGGRSILTTAAPTTAEVDKAIDDGIELCLDGKYAQGLQLLRRTAERAHRLKFTMQEAYAYFHLGGFQLKALEREFSQKREQATLKGIRFTIPPERFEQAERHLQKALRLKPELPEAFQIYRMLGYIYREQGKNLNAVASLTQSLKLNKNFAQAHNDLGETYFALGQYDDANTEYKLALHIDDKLPAPHFNLGLFYSPKEIAASLPKSRELASQHLQAFLELTAEEAPDMPERIVAQRVLNELADER
ncbi:MAG: tetratricopeptide repeat protein [Planctomycetota bacterium]|jgi:Flp pilus assembly protein TadD